MAKLAKINQGSIRLTSPLSLTSSLTKIHQYTKHFACLYACEGKFLAQNFCKSIPVSIARLAFNVHLPYLTLLPVHRAKKMPQNQLDEAHDLANAGKEEISQGSVKLSGDDHQVAIEDTVVEKAKKQTSKAVENLRKNFNREHQKGFFLHLADFCNQHAS